MSSHALRRTVDSLELLERMLNNSALSTKRVTHNDILGLGDELFKKTYVDVDSMKAEAVREALAAEEKRHIRELKASLARRENELKRDKNKALDKQKQYYEDLAKRVAEQRDRAEEERVRQLGKQYDKAREDALAAQWEECERLKLEAIHEATTALRRQLRTEFAWERERAIADALDKQKGKFLIREHETMKRTKCDCEVKARREAECVAEAHAKAMAEMKDRYDTLEEKLRKEVALHSYVARDFKEMQVDYKRFMDYTDGQYHSDYMMRLRRHGMRLANTTPVKPVTIEEITTLWET